MMTTRMPMMPSRRLFALAALLLGSTLAAAPGLAQTSGTVTPRALAPGVQVDIDQPPGGAGANSRIDETALRYYARIGDVARLEAEIARLKSIDPSWQPPRDLFAPQPVQTGVNEQPFWDLLSGGKYAEARAAIAEQRRKEPSWTPSANLLKELDLAEANARLVNASDGQRHQEVLDIATATPDIIKCNRLDAMWRTAEAYAKLGQADRAFDTYRTIVTSCPKAKERRDTLFKANQNLPPEKVRELADLGSSTNPAQGEDYAIVRRALTELNVGRTLERLGARGANPPAADLEAAEANVSERREAGGALALGWFYQNRRQFEKARDWFTRSNEWAPGEQPVEGLVLALGALNQREAATAAAEPYKGKSTRVDAALRAIARPQGGRGGGGPSGPSALDLALARRDWSACLATIESERRARRLTAGLAQQRGWCLMELDRPMEAEAAFQEARALAAKAPAKERQEISQTAAYGGMVARLRTDGETSSVMHDLSSSDLTPERKLELRASGLANQALRAYDEERFRDVLRILDARKELVPESRGLTMMRGWSHYQLNHHQTALEIFEELDRRLSTPDTQNAVSVARQVVYRGG